jgi:hypothetical protein
MKYYTDNWLKNNNHIKTNVSNIKKNESVKISNGREKFWVKILLINKFNNIIFGTIDNQLILNSLYNIGDIVQFSYENILDYQSENDIYKLKKIMNNVIQETMINNNCSIQDALKIIYNDNNILNKNN